MRRKGRILLMDDERRWRNELSDILQGDGFQTTAVATSADALDELDSTLYHLAVLDINLEDANPLNTEGMHLLQRLEEAELLGAIKVIMLSAFGTKDQMRQAFAQYNVADFLTKEEFEDVQFLDLIHSVFDRRIQSNFDLDIRWDGLPGPEPAVLHLEVNGTRIKDGTRLQAQMATELDDLLCRLFYTAKSLIASKLASGHGGSAVLLVRPFYEQGAGQPVVVKFGDFHCIDTEYKNFREYAQNYIGGYRSSTILGLSRTPHLGGVTYSFLGESSDQIESFREFYKDGELAQVKETLTNLFKKTCGEWYANPGQLQPLDLAADYQGLFRLTPEILSRALNERLKMVQFKHRLIFNSLDGERTFVNPIVSVAHQSFIKPTYVCITHGDLNGDNILVDNVGHTWLIDFFSTGRGHIFRDIAKLDSVIRFELLAPQEASLEERFRMEEALCQAETFAQAAFPPDAFQTSNPAVAKSYAAVLHLRQIAHGLVVNRSQSEISEYYIALLYCALNTIRFYSLPTLQLQHALLSASLLAERLGLQ